MADIVKSKTATAMAKLKQSNSYKGLSYQETAATFESMRDLIAKAAGRYFRPEQMIQAATTLVRNNPALQGCSPSSIMGGVIQASLMKLSLAPSLGHAYLVPVQEFAHFWISYRGWIQLAMDANLMLTGEAIYSNDEFDVFYEPVYKVRHKPAWRDRGELIGAYAKLKFPDGTCIVKVLNKQDIESLRQRNSSQRGEPKQAWLTDPEAMYIAKAMKKLKHYIPTREDFMKTAVATDENVVNVEDIIEGHTNVDALPGYEEAEEVEADVVEQKPADDGQLFIAGRGKKNIDDTLTAYTE